jgi:hypothetical protein
MVRGAMALETTGQESPFVMLGLIHRDHEGPALLRGWLEAIDPAVITVEFTRHGLDFRRVAGHGDGRSLFMDIPFEYEVSEAFARQRAVPIYCIDMDLFSHVRLREVVRTTGQRPEPVSVEEHVGSGGAGKALARLCLQKGVAVPAYTDEMLIRDRYMARKIEVLMRYHGGRRLLHICGWQHLRDPYGVYDRLKPEKVSIYDETLRF